MEFIIGKCEELGLDQEESDLLLDLLGWNIKKTGEIPPKSTRGLKIYRGLPWYEPRTAEQIKALCERFLDGHLKEVQENPDQFFYEHYTHRTVSRGVGTLLRQLDITTSDVDYNYLDYIPPEGIYRSFAKILGHILHLYCENHGTKTPTD